MLQWLLWACLAKILVLYLQRFTREGKYIEKGRFRRWNINNSSVFAIYFQAFAEIPSPIDRPSGGCRRGCRRLYIESRFLEAVWAVIKGPLVVFLKMFIYVYLTTLLLENTSGFFNLKSILKWLVFEGFEMKQIDSGAVWPGDPKSWSHRWINWKAKDGGLFLLAPNI